jgi:transposase
MKFPPLSKESKNELEKSHRYEGDGRVRDRIKAVLLKSEGWSNNQIAQALRIHEQTVHEHLSDWLNQSKLNPENGGSQSKLDASQTKVLRAHLDQVVYRRVVDICGYIESRFAVHYTVSGMTKWLKKNQFSYKYLKAVPAKADVQEQEEFIEKYLILCADKPAEEPIVFMDSAHPTMGTKVSRAWLKKGVDKPIAQSASRTRVNVMGAIELGEMRVVSHCPEYVNAETTVAFFDQLKAAYPQAPKIHIVLDQSGYHRSQLVKDTAQKMGIVLHYLPAYSPNLNPIERLWKVMNERVRNNVFFESAKAFRLAITDFFENTVSTIVPILRQRINDDFQTIKPVPSS